MSDLHRPALGLMNESCVTASMAESRMFARAEAIRIRTASAYPNTPEGRMLAELQEAERRAWDSLARYKFVMFGYWAGVWVHLNRISGQKLPNPFSDLVREAREVREDMFPARPTRLKLVAGGAQ